MEKVNQTPHWIRRQGFFEVKVLCPDEETHAVIRNMTSKEHGACLDQKERLSEFEFQKLMIKTCLVSWTVKSMDGQEIPHFRDIPPQHHDEQIWEKLPGIWFHRMVQAILHNESPERSDSLGGA